MSRLPESTLRRAAWGPSLLLVAMIVVGVLLSFAEPQAVTRQGVGWDDSSPRSDAAFAAFILVFPLVGLLILRRHPRNTVGWLLQGIGLTWGLAAVCDNYSQYALVVDPGALPAADVVAALGEGLWVPAVGLMGGFLFLLFPDGRPPSPRWRLVGWLCAGTMAVAYLAVTLRPGRLTTPTVVDNPLALPVTGPVFDVVAFGSAALLPVCVLACAAALVTRFRRARGVERLQLRWLASAGGCVALMYLSIMGLGALAMVGTFGDEAAVRASWLGLLETVTVTSFVLIPVSIGIALLRYRLYDLDLVVNRTLVYGTLTAALAAVYLVLVLVLQLALRPLTDQSDLAVAASTLAVAGLFRPVRARIQSVVDRRFFRRRYDAARTLAEFTSRLRHEVDLEAVGADLRATVRDSVSPAHVSLWTRSDP